MALINLRTNLKSLRYGKDTPGGGDSGQPYIQKSIPDGYTNKSPDFILRGGLLAAQDTLEDISRLTKMFFDLRSPNGLLFTAKQNLLSRTAVRTQTSGVLNEGIYTPLSTLAQAGVVAFGGHLNKQGIDPFIPTGAYANGGGLFNVNDIKLYSQVVKNTQPLDNNRLYQLYDLKIQNNTFGDPNIITYQGGPGSILGVGNTNIRFADQRTGINNIKPYTGNETWTPNQEISRSFTTLIEKETSIGASKAYATVNQFTLNNNTTDGTRVYESGSKVGPDGKLFNPLATSFITWTPHQDINRGLSELLIKGTNVSSSKSISKFYSGNFGSILNYSSSLANSVYDSSFGDGSLINTEKIYNEGTITFNQTLINSQIPNSLGSPKIQDFRKILRESGASEGMDKGKIDSGKINGSLIESPDYIDKGYENRVNIGGKNGNGPGSKQGKNLSSYTNSSGIGPVDKINALPIYRSSQIESKYPVNDLIKFRIAAINNNNPNLKDFIHFRAFINSFSDSYNSTWADSSYLGRGEKFHTYNGFDRSIDLSFTVAAQSKEELIPMYKKLNYLASNLTPDYSPNGYMRGPLIQLTMGGYLYEQVGFITNLSYTINDDTTWEIGLDDIGNSDPTVKELPHRIEISSFSFTPIHNFRPQKQELNFGTDNLGYPDSYGNQHYIALRSDTDISNYTINDEFRPL